MLYIVFVNKLSGFQLNHWNEPIACHKCLDTFWSTLIHPSPAESRYPFPLQTV